MVTLQARTRLQLQTSILHSLGAVRELTASATGTTTTFVTNQMPLGATDDHRGKWLHFTSGANNSGLRRRVTASAVASSVTTLTFAPAVTDATANLDTAQLIGWNGAELHPQRVDEAINTAIQEITGRYYDPVESLAHHADGRTSTFVVPTTMRMIRDVMVRRSVESVTIHDATTAWDAAAAPANVTRSVDTEDYKRSGASNKFVIAGAFTTGVISSKAITALNLAKYDYVEFWIKSTIATAAGDFTLGLDDTALLASELEVLSVPALVADTWTYVRVALANPETDTAIISVGLRAANNIAANTLWISDVKAVRDASARWEALDVDVHWNTEKEARALVLTAAGVRTAGYSLLKLIGGDRPALLTADSGVTEVPEGYIIARATALALLSGMGSPTMDTDVKRQLAQVWLTEAERERRRMPILQGVRVVT